jgi:hypothetical protein
MKIVIEQNSLSALATLVVAIGTIALSVIAVRHTNSGIPALVAGQALPAGLSAFKKQISRLWPELAERLNLS